MATLNTSESPKFTTCLWFDTEAEAAANFYVSVFKNGHIKQIDRYPDYGQDVHGKPAGSVMTVLFEINGQEFLALNGGPHFKFDEAISFVINCDSQDEVDYYWNALTEKGQESFCGWVKDPFGMSWQVTPRRLNELMRTENPEKRTAVFAAMMGMKKLDIAVLEAAAR